jgi:hypothetical protein
MKKVMQVSITNKENYPVEITLRTNNLVQTFSVIQPNEKKEFDYEFSKLTKTDGAYNFFVKNMNTQQVDSFSNGYLTSGDLCNYLEVYARGGILQVKASN